LVPLAVTENVAGPASGADADEDDARGPASTAPEAELLLDPAALDPAAYSAVGLGAAADPAATLEENDS